MPSVAVAVLFSSHSAIREFLPQFLVLESVATWVEKGGCLLLLLPSEMDCEALHNGQAGRGPMVYGCLYCAKSYQKTLATLNFADSKTHKKEKREKLFENLKLDDSIGWEVDVIDPRELSAKMLKRTKINLNDISHNSAMGLVKRLLDVGVLLTEVKHMLSN
ncbi:hypothetical protein ZIOFF_011962 [Zingiber officinale]|uniref:Ribonuclease n=1 Tax=Zingiber officinale TaxID=94328 RepID=A0A8J5HRM7_ZINOF|nr:hypothetical protein ZIOFF_011962 [Zingiber officinale]